MGLLIVGILAGILIFFFASTTWFYRGCVRDAEQKRDEAQHMAAQALEAKATAEDGFSKAKQFFDERNKIPLVALFTEEQMDKLAGILAERLFMSQVRTEKVQ
jgi:hypothetical protein